MSREMKSNQLNVLYLHQYFETPDQFGGLRTYKNALHLVQKGYHVTVLSAAGHYHSRESQKTEHLIRKEVIQGIEVLWVSSLFEYHKSFFSRLLSFLAFMVLATWYGLRTNPQVVYATSPPLTVFIPGFIISRMKRANLIFEVRDIWPESAVTTGVLQNPLLIKVAQKLEKFAYKTSKTVVAVSGGIKEALIKNGVAADKICVVPHGVDLEYFKTGVVNANFRQQYGLEGKFVALYAGSFGWANGLEQVIEAARLLVNVDQIHFVLLGDGKEKERLLGLARQYNLSNITFADPVPKRDVGAIISSANAGLMILREAKTFATVLPNKLLDYMAAGLPVIINFEGFASSLVKQAGAGFLVASSQSEELAKSLMRLWRDNKLCRRLGCQGRTFVETFYSRENQVKQFECVVLNDE